MQKTFALPSLDKKFFFIGISGIGMSALAIFFKKLGYHVSGSSNHNYTDLYHLQDTDISFFVGHKKENIEDYDYVVYSTAISQSNLELVAAKELGKKILHRSQALAMLMMDQKSVCVAGCHGKTTTTSIITHCLMHMNAKFNAYLGGIINSIGTNAFFTKNAKMFITEADESDKSFLNLFHDILVITNIELDHLETFQSYEEILDTYVQFAKNHKGEQTIILCNEDAGCKDFLTKIKKDSNTKIISYGFGKDSDFFATEITSNKLGTKFVLNHNGEQCSVSIRFYGRHNVLNAMAAIATCFELGFKKQESSVAIGTFLGTKRRFSILHNEDVVVVDDYAHHPVEVASVISSAKEFIKQNNLKRLVCVFEPHRYSRLQNKVEEFASTFNLALNNTDSQLYITPLYTASEQAIEGVNSAFLASKIKQNTHLIDQNEQIEEIFHQNKAPGDLWLFMGAGYISSFANKIKFK